MNSSLSVKKGKGDVDKDDIVPCWYLAQVQKDGMAKNSVQLLTEYYC